MTEAIEATETETKPRGRPAKESAAEADKPLKMFKLTIHSGEDKGDKGDVFLGHNGKSYLIQRDNEAIVPECIIDVLSHTVIETTVKDESGNERIVKIPRFAYNVSPA